VERFLVATVEVADLALLVEVLDQVVDLGAKFVELKSDPQLHQAVNSGQHNEVGVDVALQQLL